jgi:D-alanine-D-alanine ligase
MYKINKEIRDKIRAYAKTIYKRANLKGVVRMDFLVAEDKAYLCEVNTVPGSLAYYFFCERISDARGFFTELIEDAVAQSKEEKSKPLTTGILKTVGFIGK